MSEPKMELRAWQKNALRTYFDQPLREDFLAVVTPGGGKTRFALTLVNMLTTVRRVVVVCPSIKVKLQWIEEAKRFGIELSDMGDTASIVVTYHAVDADPEFFAGLMAETPTGVIFDEIHHASEKRRWGKSLLRAFADAHRRVCLTGTAFRSDSTAIPFVTYDEGLCRHDYSYGYAQGVKDEVVREIEFPLFEGMVGWQKDGEEKLHSFADCLRKSDQGERLNACLDADGGFMRSMLTAANERLKEYPGDGGLVIAKNCKHANAIAKALHDITGKKPVVVHRQGDAAQVRLGRFTNSKDRWLVAVKMVSEGVDIPRLRVLVYATNVSTEMAFRQAIGRISRGTGRAFCFIPAHDSFLEMATGMREEIIHEIAETVETKGVGNGGGGPRSEVVALFSEGWESRVVRAMEGHEWDKKSAKVEGKREEAKSRNAERSRLRYQNPEYRDKILEFNRISYQDPEVKERKIKYSFLRRQSPEVKAREAARHRINSQDPEAAKKKAEYMIQYRARKKAEREAKKREDKGSDGVDVGSKS